MGTRNLTMVEYKKQIRVAQYGQWDGYPTGQGVTIANFLQNKLDLKKFKEAVLNCRQVDEKRQKEMWVSCGAEPDSDLVPMAVSEKFAEKYPEFHRNTGADILELIQDKGVTEIDLQTEFAADSLFCEWAYVVNLDNETVEIFKGFNTKPLKKGERFFAIDKEHEVSDRSYYAIKHAITIPFKEFTEQRMHELEEQMSKDEEE